MKKQHFDFENTTNRIMVLLAILTNSGATTSDTRDNIPYYFSINRMYRILKIPKVTLRNDFYQIFHFFQTKFPMQDMFVPLGFSDTDSFDAIQRNPNMPQFYPIDYPEDWDTLFDMSMEFLDAVAYDRINLRTNAPVEADAFVRNSFVSGKYDRLPFRIHQSQSESSFASKLLDELNVYMTYEEAKLLDDFLLIHDMGSNANNSERYLQYSKQLFATPLIQNANTLMQEIQKILATTQSVCCQYGNQSIDCLPIQLLFFSQLRQYHLACLTTDGPIFLELSKIQFDYKSNCFFIPSKHNIQASINPSAIETFKRNLPYMWGPNYDKRTHVSIKIYNDNNGRVFKKAAMMLTPYVNLPGNELIKDTEWTFTGTIIDLEAFTSWVMGYGASMIIEKPIALKKRMIKHYQNLLI